MPPETIEISLSINHEKYAIKVSREEILRDALRRLSFYSVKHGCEDGTCGACMVLIDGKPVHSCRKKAVDAVGVEITTLEGLSPEGELHPIQRAFMENGAVQCGFCTPAQILNAKALLDKNPSPNESEIRQAMNPVLCRCTGYVRLVDAIQKAAAVMRGDEVPSDKFIQQPLPEDIRQVTLPEAYYRRDHSRDPLPPLVLVPKDMAEKKIVGKAEVKLDAEKLVRGKPVFTDDLRLDGMLYGALLTSPHAHARIKKIDASKACALPGVHAVLTWQDIPRIKYASGGQSYPQPKPLDQVSLDQKVRHEGDRVAVAVADTPDLAQKALDLIEVEYEILPAVLNPLDAMKEGAPVIHDEPDTPGIYNNKKNIVQHVEVQVGDVDQAFKEADRVFSREYRTGKQQHVHIEPHACITYWDENHRLVIRTSTQVPYHVRRIVAPLINLSIKQIRVVKPRIGGGFGNKQEIILEDLCALLTLKTGRPVRMEYSRLQEFTSSRSRHPEILRYKIGVKEGRITAAELYMIADTGAYGTHSLTVPMAGAFKGLSLYNPPNARFLCDAVYTNTPPSGAFRGYGAMQCQYGMENIVGEAAEELGIDVIKFKRDNWIKPGEELHLSSVMGEGPVGTIQVLKSSALEQCVEIGMKATDYASKHEAYRKQEGRFRRGIGMSVVLHGSGVADLDMASASIKMNDDGSFNLLIGASDLGTGSDTILSQMAAEELGVPLEDIIVYSSDTDFTPFDKGAYASSTTYISGGAVRNAARQVREQILEQAALMLKISDRRSLVLENRKVIAPDGRSVSMEEVALSSLHLVNQHQIMTVASHRSLVSPPPTAAQFAEVVVDMESGKVAVDRLLMMVDCGRVINPLTACGQVEGGMTQALGSTLTEEMLFDEAGHQSTATLSKYRIPRYKDMPVMDVIFVQTNEPDGPFGAKSIGEISIDGVAPAVTSAIHNAAGVWVRQIPCTPERVKAALAEQGK